MRNSLNNPRRDVLDDLAEEILAENWSEDVLMHNRRLAKEIRDIADAEVGKVPGKPGPSPHVWARVDENSKIYHLNGKEGFREVALNSPMRSRLRLLIIEMQRYVGAPQFMDDFVDKPMVYETGSPVMEEIDNPVVLNGPKILRQKTHLAHIQRTEWAEKNLNDEQRKFFKQSPLKATILDSAQTEIIKFAKFLKEKGWDKTPEAQALCWVAEHSETGLLHDMSQYRGYDQKDGSKSNLQKWDALPPEVRWQIADDFILAFRRVLDAVEAAPINRDWLKVDEY